MAYVVDTSVFIAIERRGLDLDELRLALPQHEAIFISSITASELLTGVHHADSVQRRLQRSTYVEDILEIVPLLPFDLLAARTHAELNHRLAREGQRIGAHDLIIAATAVAHGVGLLTNNTREFARIPGLEVREPDW